MIWENMDILEDFLRKYDEDVNVIKPITLRTTTYWVVGSFLTLPELKKIFKKEITIHELGNTGYYFIDASSLSTVYGDRRGFYDFDKHNFNVKCKSGFEIEDRLQNYGFCNFGGYIGTIDDEQVMFIRVPSTTDAAKIRFCEVLNLSPDDVGCVQDDSDLLAGSAWFYFKV